MKRPSKKLLLRTGAALVVAAGGVAGVVYSGIGGDADVKDSPAQTAPADKPLKPIPVAKESRAAAEPAQRGVPVVTPAADESPAEEGTSQADADAPGRYAGRYAMDAPHGDSAGGDSEGGDPFSSRRGGSRYGPSPATVTAVEKTPTEAASPAAATTPTEDTAAGDTAEDTASPMDSGQTHAPVQPPAAAVLADAGVPPKPAVVPASYEEEGDSFGPSRENTLRTAPAARYGARVVEAPASEVARDTPPSYEERTAAPKADVARPPVSHFQGYGSSADAVDTPPSLSAVPDSSSAGTAPAPSTPAEASGPGTFQPRGERPLATPGTAPSAPAADVTIPASATPGAKYLEGPQTPSLTIEKIAPPEIQIGKPAVFAVKVRNAGQATADGVVVSDRVPQGTRLVSTNPQAETGEAGTLTWHLGELKPGDEQTVRMEVMPLEEGEIGSVATVALQAQATVRTICTRPKLVLKSSGPAKVLIGDNVTFSITISNPGTGAATGVILAEDVPEGLYHSAGESLEFEVGTLKPGESRNLELTLKAASAGMVSNVIRARGDGSLNAESATELEVIAPRLEVAMRGPTLRYLERKATYQVTVSNPGTAPAKDIELVAHLPKGLKFVSTNNAGQYDARSHAIYWSLEELPPQDAGTVELIAMPIETGEQKLRVEGRAKMDLKAEHEKMVRIDGLAALNFEVADAADPIEVGKETIYEVRVVNQGSKSSSNVRVAAVLPPGMQPVSAGGPVQGTVQGQQVTFAPLPRLAPKADAQYKIRVKGLAAGDQRIRVLVQSDDLARPVTKEESTRVYTDR